ncbi:MAG: HEAT repeat domain-containing protein [Actinomycetota bacterium]
MPSGSGRISITPDAAPSTDRDALVRLLDDPTTFLAHGDAATRRLAISVCASRDLDRNTAVNVAALAVNDTDGAVRAAAVEVLGGSAGEFVDALDRARSDEDERVVEALATAYGERREASAVPWLIDLATSDADRASREAAVAALGAIGDDAAVPVLLELVADAPPQVRRRAVVALTVFDEPGIESAIRAAAKDRNPSVRETAEMVVGRDPS